MNAGNFDKFIDDILLKEQRKKKVKQDDKETPQREHAKRYREQPHNRITYKKQK